MFKIKNGTLVEFDKYGLGSGVEEIQIPDGIVTIGKKAFNFCSNIKKVIIPDSVIEIQDSAFSFCSNLESVILPDSVVSIGAGSFLACSSLKKIKLPKNLSVIENTCFCSCTALEQIEFPSALTLIRSEAFDRCESLSSVSLPDSVVTIEKAAFRNCTNLSSIVIPSNLSKCEGAFYESHKLVNYTNLENNPNFTILNNALCTRDGKTLIQCLPCVAGKYVVPDSVSYISDYAFYNNQEITEIVLPDDCTIAPTAFVECSNLPAIDDFVIIKNILVKYIGNNRSVVIPNNIDVISGYAFYENTEIEEIAFPEYLKVIGECAFYGCSSLKKVDLPYYLRVLDECAFDSCSSLEYVSISGNVKEISVGCFSGCTSLSEVVLHEGIEIVKDSAFYGCENLSELKFPYGTKKIGSIFSGDDPVKRVFIPETVTEMDEFGFGIQDLEWHVQNNSYAKRFAQQNAELYNYTIIDTSAETFNAKESQPNPYIIDGNKLVTYLGSGVDVLTVPDGIQIVGKSAFASSDVKTIVVPNGVTTICTDAFANCNALENVVVLGDSTTIEEGAFHCCENLQKVIVPSANTRFEVGAFYRDETAWLLYRNRNLCLYCTNSSQLIRFAFTEKIKYATIDNPIIAENPEDLITVCNELSHRIVDTAIFNVDGDVLVGVNAGAIEESGVVIIPQFIKAIGDGAFKNVPTAERIVLPEGLKTIGAEAFMNCGATAIEIPESVTSIGDYAFFHSHIARVVIPKVQSIAPYTFAKCIFLTDVQFPATLMEIGESAFAECAELKMVALPAGLIEIKDNAFSNCTGLRLVSIPNSVVNIGNDCFKERSLNCIFICSKDSHAYEYSKHNCIVTATDWEKVAEQIQVKESLIDKQKPISVQCCGSTITLTANYNIFYKTIMLYADMADELFCGFVKNYTGLINDYSKEKAAQLIVDMEMKADQAVNELGKLGVYAFNIKNYFYHLNEGLPAVLDQINAVLEWMRELYDAKTDSIYAEGNAILWEASSKIKGLSYGIITSSPLLLAAHAVDEFRAKVQQRHEASAFALSELKKLETQLDSRLAAEYAKTMEAQVYPAIQASLQTFVEQMLETHIDLLQANGILPEKMMETYDIEKSNKLLDAELADSQQKVPTLLKALAYCPHNLKVYEKLLAENVNIAELKEIASVVGIAQELDVCKQKVQAENERRRQEAAIAEQKRLEQLRREQEAAKRKAEQEKLQAQISALETELATLKGLFVGKRKKELTAEIAALQEKLRLL